MPHTKAGPFVTGVAPALNAGHMNVLDSQYDDAMADVESPTLTVTRDTSGAVSTVTLNTVAQTVTRDNLGRVATITRLGITRTITRDSSGRVTGIA